MFDKIKGMLSLERWIENFEGYLDARIELVKYDLREWMVGVLTKSIFLVGMLIFGMAALFCLNFGLAYLIGFWLGAVYAGFLILAAFYGLITLWFFLKKDDEKLNARMEARIREAMQQPKAEESTTNQEQE